jgi:hypothetical protein
MQQNSFQIQLWENDIQKPLFSTMLLNKGHHHFVAPLDQIVLNTLKSICSSNAIKVSLSALPDPESGLQNV